MVQFARATRHAELADVPTARELAKNETARALIELAELPYTVSRPFAAPPGAPPARAKALQAAFLAAHRDPVYLEEAGKLGIDISPVGGEEVLRAIDRIAAAPPDLLDYVRKLLAENPDLQRELARTLSEADSRGLPSLYVEASGPRSVALGGNNLGSIGTGDNPPSRSGRG